MGIERDGLVMHIMDAMASPCDTEEVQDPAFGFQELPLDLTKLPIVKYFPKDAGRYISAGVVISEYGGRRNASYHRMLIRDKDSIGIRLVPRHTFTLYNEARKNGEDLKVAICIGAPAEVMVSAALSVYDCHHYSRVTSAKIPGVCCAHICSAAEISVQTAVIVQIPLIMEERIICEVRITSGVSGIFVHGS